MASMVLGTVGTIFGGPIGGFIGATIGGFIDNQLFPQKQQGPRLSDLAVQVSTYGQIIPKLYGPECRMAGNIIWSSGLIETAHKQKQGGKGGPTVQTTTYSYSVNIAVAIADAQRKPLNAIRRVWANAKLVYSAPGESGSVVPDPVSAKVWSEFVFHDGSFSQMPDSLLEGAIGIGDTPAYRGTCYVVIWGLQLADYGNRIPNLEFLVEADEAITVDAVLEDIVGQCGLDTNKISTSGLDDEVRGYSIGSPSTGTGAIQPLALAFDFDSSSVGGAVRFMKRGSGLAGIVPSSFMAAHQGGEDRPELIHWTRDAETQLPQQATLSFADPDRNWQVNAQIARRVAGSAQANLSAQLPMVVDVPLAAQITDRLLWEAWNTRDSATCDVDDRMIDLIPGKVYLFDTPAGLEPLRLRTKQRGANGVIRLELLRDRAEVYESTRQGVPAAINPNEIDVPQPTELMIIDTPILQDSDDDTGFYYLVDGQGSGWRGADIVRSTDSGATYNEVAPAGRQSVLGVTDHLGDGVTAVMDLVNTFRVVLDDTTDELTSCSLDDLLNGNNACWVGGLDGEDGEILQFQTATLIAPGVYDLTRLLRGRLGTEYATGAHGTGDRFVLLTTGTIYRADFGPADWNSTRQYKAVSLLTLEADATPQDFTNTGEGKRPLSPVNIVGVYDHTTFDTAVTWNRRSRLRSQGLAGPVPLGEASEAYEIDVIVAAVVVRTLTSTIPSVTYTHAMRVADAGSGFTVQIAVYQMSDVRGRGRPGFAEI